MGSFFMMYGRKCYTTILPRVTTWPIVFVYRLQNMEDTLPNICLQFMFVYQIDDDKMSYELVEYPNNKIIQSKNC